MSATSSWVNLLTSQIESVGRAAVHALFPNDIEYYMVALELTDSRNNTIDYLTFPVMPDSISKTEPNRNNVKKSLSGVTVLSNPSFTPQDISIKGTFGKQFKILLTPVNILDGVAFSTLSGKYTLSSINGAVKNLVKTSFGSVNVKTGYGVTKILQAMASKSVGLDKDGKPMRLFFYNMALGESYLVVISPTGLQLSQDISKNMIWNYNLTMTAIAPLESVKSASAIRILTAAVIQSGVNALASQVNKELDKVL